MNNTGTQSAHLAQGPAFPLNSIELHQISHFSPLNMPDFFHQDPWIVKSFSTISRGKESDKTISGSTFKFNGFLSEP